LGWTSTFTKPRSFEPRGISAGAFAVRNVPANAFSLQPMIDRDNIYFEQHLRALAIAADKLRES
jgi:hypothetical protein